MQYDVIINIFSTNFLSHQQFKKELIKFSNVIITEHNESVFLQLLAACITKNDTDYLNLLAPLFISFQPKLSSILKISHIFCCPYKPSKMEDWDKNNPELFETEIYFFKILFEKFHQDIVIDVPIYVIENIRENYELDQSEEGKLKLLFSLIIYFDIFFE